MASHDKASSAVPSSVADEQGDKPVPRKIPKFTLRDGYDLVCDALMVELVEDPPNQARLIQARTLMEDGHKALGWAIVMRLVEGVIGEPFPTV